MKILQYIVPLITGAFIGYITNWIAIKMLFRPYKEKYIGKIRIPFTPGLIPKERKRISQSISSTISEYLLTDIMVIKELKSQRLIEKIELIIKDKINKFNAKEVSVRQAFKFILGEKTEEVVKAIKYKISETIYEAFDEDLKTKFIKIVQGVTYDKIFNNTLQGLLGEKFNYHISCLSKELSPKILTKLKYVANSKDVEQKIYNTIKQEVDKKVAGMGFLGMLGGGLINPESISTIVIDRINEELDKDEIKGRLEELIIEFVNDQSDQKINELIPENYQPLLYEKIDEFINYGISNNISSNLIYEIVEEKTSLVLDQKININEYVEKIITSRCISSYDIIVSKYANEFIESIGIEQIIEREINAFETQYLENIIIKVAHKELSAITKLGALIGFILAGFIILF